MSLLASVIIPTYNRAKVLELCLNALLNQTADPTTYEIIVVDDGSTDNTPDLVKELSEKAHCSLVHLRQENSGRSRARNNGIRAAKGVYILLLDSDMIVRPEYIAAHISAHTRPGLIVNGAVVNTSNFDNPTKGPKHPIHLSRAVFATGNVSIKRTDLLYIGLFDEDFVEYGWEDLELGERLRLAGYKSVNSSAACSFHLEPRITFKDLPNLLKKERERGHNAVIFFQKNPSSNVRLMTLITPVYFFLDRITTLCNWSERPGTYKLLERLDRKGYRTLFEILFALIKSHAYADGIREKLKELNLKI